MRAPASSSPRSTGSWGSIDRLPASTSSCVPFPCSSRRACASASGVPDTARADSSFDPKNASFSSKARRARSSAASAIFSWTSSAPRSATRGKEPPSTGPGSIPSPAATRASLRPAASSWTSPGSSSTTVSALQSADSSARTSASVSTLPLGKPPTSAVNTSPAETLSPRAIRRGFIVSSSSREQMPFQRAQRHQIMRRREDVDMGKRRLHPLRERLVSRAAEQRIEPDHLPAPQLQRLQLRPEERRVPGVPAVAEDDHDGASVHQPQPVAVEGREALADARPAGPVVHLGGEPAQHLRVVGLPEHVGHPPQLGGEDEALHPRHRALERVEELQQEAAVQVHRARHVAEGDDARLARLAPAEPQLQRLAGIGQGSPDGPAQIDARPPPARLPTAAGAGGEPAGQAPGDALDLLQLLGAEAAEILAGQRGHGAGTGHVFWFALPFALLLLAPVRQRRGRALAGRGAAAHPDGSLGSPYPRRREERGEGVVEDLRLFRPPDQHAAQRQVRALPALDAAGAQSADRIDRMTRGHRHP